MTKLLTNSEMKLWRRCRRQWWLSHYRGLRRADVEFNRPLSIGNRVHQCLEVLYSVGERGNPLAKLRETVDADLAKFPMHATDIAKEADLCQAMLEGYLQWLEEEGCDIGFRVVASEGRREAPLIDGVNLLAKLDARVVHEERADIRLALEHKTVGDLSTPLTLLQIDTQLLTEHLVEFLALREEGRESEAAQGVLYNMLRKCKRTARAKPPFFGREEVNHNVHELRAHWLHVQRVAEEILQAERELLEGKQHHEVVYPNPTRDCKWDCEFFHLCPLLNDGSDYEALIAADYVTGNPLERYDLAPTQVAS